MPINSFRTEYGVITITFPDGNSKGFACAPTVAEVAGSISQNLADAAIAARVDGKLRDVSDVVEQDAEVLIITKSSQESIEIIRHSCAHLLGHALKQLYPQAQMAIGPVIADGFYYDVAMENTLSLDDLEKIEERMKSLAKKAYPVLKRMVARDEAITIFDDRREKYKLRLIADMPQESELALYFHEEYVDMCRGPHVPSMQHMGGV